MALARVLRLGSHGLQVAVELLLLLLMRKVSLDEGWMAFLSREHVKYRAQWPQESVFCPSTAALGHGLVFFSPNSEK